jgi:hypothetical protein
VSLDFNLAFVLSTYLDEGFYFDLGLKGLQDMDLDLNFHFGFYI